MELGRSFFTVSLLSLVLVGFNSNAAIFGEKMSAEEKEAWINSLIITMESNEEFLSMSECSGISSNNLKSGFKQTMSRCYDNSSTPIGFNKCVDDGVTKLTGLTIEKIDQCDMGVDADSQKKIDEIQEQIDAIDEKDVLTESDELKLDQLYAELDAIYDVLERSDEQLRQEMIDALNENHGSLAPLELDFSSDDIIDVPWRELPPRYDHLPSDEASTMRNRWAICSNMSRDSVLVAETIGAVKKHPDRYAITDKQNQTQMKDKYHASYGTFLDVIDRKILELGFAHWVSAGTSAANYEIAQSAWNWCINQPLHHFEDLDDSRLD
ncbi:coiled-coil domain-containing protein [Enterovibrio calviensis]|uniref:hypothetical protein n=1 Tax=Enterovibrio calviensis TaxID=91359 RepID=UPI0004852585|nr:hypothetical protein [Enterovibrio calviensis]